MEEGSIKDAKNFTVDKFNHASSSQIENANAVFTSEKLDTLDKIVHTINNLTINNAEYYESNTATASDAQGNPTKNPETVTQTRNG